MLSACQWGATSQPRRKVFLLRWPRQTPSHPLWALRLLLPLNPTVVLLSIKGGFPVSPHTMACPTPSSHLLRLFSVRGTFLLKVFTSIHCPNSSAWHLRPFIEWCKPPFQYKSVLLKLSSSKNTQDFLSYSSKPVLVVFSGSRMTFLPVCNRKIFVLIILNLTRFSSFLWSIAGLSKAKSDIPLLWA